MKFSSDLTIGQRLGLGFGLYLLLLAGVLSTFVSWHGAAARAQSEYAERIIPLRDLVNAATTSIYLTGLDVRSVLLEPSITRVGVFEQRAAASEAAFEHLAKAIVEPGEKALYKPVADGLATYLAYSDDLVRRRTAGSFQPDEELQLRALREQLLASLGEFDGVVAQRAAAALAEIGNIRVRTSRGLLALSLLSVLVISVLTWLIARSISTPTRALLTRVSALEGGDWKPMLQLAPTAGAAPPRNEIAKLSAAFGSAAIALERREQRVIADQRLGSTLVEAIDRTALARTALDSLVTHLGVELGIFYVCSRRSPTLVPRAQIGIGGNLPRVEFGDGLPGEAASSRRTRLLTAIPADCALQIKLGYDQTLPKAVVAVPVVFREQVHGVILLASLRAFDADALAYLEAGALQLGIGMQNLRAFEEVQQLLAQVQEKNENIQSQNEELQAQNEEIQAQQEEVQAQHEEIQAQNEELMQQSEDLHSQAAALADGDERKNAFLGVLAHELRNPMAPIVNGLHILKRCPAGSEPALAAQAVIERQATHLVRLIDDLLDITRISEGKVNLNRERLDFVQMARDCVQDLRACYQQSGIVIDLEVPEHAIFVEGDRTRLCQVIGNLLNNSMKFCDSGGHVRVVLSTEAGRVRLEVLDDGIGMDADLLPRLFQSFSQGISGLARTKGGLGLGLSLVKALVELHHGTVSAHSDGLARGARFTVHLPLCVEQGRDAWTPAIDPVDTPSTGYRLLIIEDNLDAANSLREALELDGFQVQIAHSARDGVALASQQRPDVVLCDIGLPDKDGYAVARALRADPRLAETVLIALTGYASAEDKRLADAAGFDHHLAKPLRLADLPALISRLRRRAESPVPG